MKVTFIAAVAAILALPAAAQNTNARGVSDGTSLGDVTKESVETYGGRTQGEHAKNSDGNGDEPGRAGLANLDPDGRGNLGYTIDAIGGQPYPD